MNKLEGKVAVITGGSSGIGLATAQRFVEEGGYVFITGRRQSELDKAKSLIGKNVTTVQGDISNLSDLDRLFETVAAEKGVVHIVVTSAGKVEVAGIDTATPEHFDKIFNINARGTFFTIQKALPLMKSGGSIVLISSGMHMKGFPMYGVYSATKAALRSFTRTWAMELKDRGIRVNMVSPGVIETPMLGVGGQFKSQEEVDAGRELFLAITPLNRLGRPDTRRSTTNQDQSVLYMVVVSSLPKQVAQKFFQVPCRRFCAFGLQPATQTKMRRSCSFRVAGLGRRRAGRCGRYYSGDWCGPLC